MKRKYVHTCNIFIPTFYFLRLLAKRQLSILTEKEINVWLDLRDSSVCMNTSIVLCVCTGNKLLPLVKKRDFQGRLANTIPLLLCLALYSLLSRLSNSRRFVLFTQSIRLVIFTGSFQRRGSRAEKGFTMKCWN